MEEKLPLIEPLKVNSISELNKLNGFEQKSPTPRTLDEMHFTKEGLERICRFATPPVGVVPNYIKELDSIPGKHETAISVGDLHGNIVTVGDNLEKITSAQSTIKVFLFLYALSKGVDPYQLAEGEAVAQAFNRDPISQGDAKKPHHQLNNAGGIHSASYVEDWDDFLSFMREITENPNIEHLDDVFRSEMKDSASNRRFSSSLEAAGAVPQGKGEHALEMYTKACALGLSCENLLKAGLFLARGAKKSDGSSVEGLDSQDPAVVVFNAMNSFGFYEKTGAMTLLQAGTKSLTAKSGVGGYVININPGEGAFVTRGHHLDQAGNSVFGMMASIPLNRYMGTPDTMRLSDKSTEELLLRYLTATEKFTANTAQERNKKGTLQLDSFILRPEAVQELINSYVELVKGAEQLKGIFGEKEKN